MPTDFQGWPDPDSLPAPPERFILHWTAGGNRAAQHDLLSYHLAIEHHEGMPEDPSDDTVAYRQGVPLDRNMRQLSMGDPPAIRDPDVGYAAHTSRFNSFSAGVALCGMRGAHDFRPEGTVSPGPSPITLEQVRALLSVCAVAVEIYGLEVSERTFFTHFEADHIHGRPQPGKWNITWIPGFHLNREDVGPYLRDQLQRWVDGEEIDPRLYEPPAGERLADSIRGQEG